MRRISAGCSKLQNIMVMRPSAARCACVSARAAEIEVANLARTEHAKAVEPFRRQVDPSVGRCGRHEENRLLADHLDMAVVQSFGEFGHRLSPSAGACRSRPKRGSARCGRRRSYQPIAVRRTPATNLCLNLTRLADVDPRVLPTLLTNRSPARVRRPEAGSWRCRLVLRWRQPLRALIWQASCPLVGTQLTT